MQYRVGIALLATCLLVAGCVGSVGGEPRTAHDSDVSEVQTTVANPSGADTEEPTGPRPLILAIETETDAGAATAYVQRAVATIENGSDGRPFVVVPETVTAGQSPLGLGPMGVQPDAVVRFADERVTCESGAGDPVPFCARDAGSARATGPARVTISQGLTDVGFRAATTAGLSRLAGTEGSPADPSLPETPFATPWPGSDPVTVTVENEVAPDREFEPLVAETLRWWAANDDRWGNYTADWRLVDDPDADVTVAFVDRVKSCGGHDDPGSLLGCAPVLDPSNLADADERVRIRGGFTDDTTLHVLKHEFGHVYGRSHGDAPTEIMDATIPTTRLAEPNATERDVPWRDTSVQVHVDYDSFGAPRGDVRRQVDHALDYYERGADGSLTRDVSIRRVSTAAAADVTIRAVDDLSCLDGSGSCGQRRGLDTDADPALEVYTGLSITVHDLDTETLGWHTGRWLGAALLGSDSPSDLPPPFRDADGADRRHWHDPGH